MSPSFSAVVHWPDAPRTKSFVLNALKRFQVKYIDEPIKNGSLLQWSTYDAIDHELVLKRRSNVLSSSYIFRKALIRKHFLSRIIHSYSTKNPTSILKQSFPLTYELEISFADELDEMWADDLWELGSRLESQDTWWILKPGMADRGMGIRLFDSKDALQQIFEEFEGDEESDGDDEDRDDEKTNDTAVVTSQLRHFVIQEYLPDPLLFDPREVSTDRNANPDSLEGRKFHLRVYCVASGALKVYVYDRILALFAGTPYEPPTFTLNEEDELPSINLQPHLTNMSLQTDNLDEGSTLLDELVGCHILSGNRAHEVFTKEDKDSIVGQIGDVLAETFKAALESSVHFQPVPNAFELYGVDLLVVNAPPTSPSRFQVKLLEFNAEPAIELSGARLTFALEELFEAIAGHCVIPFFEPKADENWPVGETRQHLLKCLDVSVRQQWD